MVEFEPMLPKVSVLVINYNQEAFIRECLESVVTQSYPYFEVVVADDCSTDSSRQIIEQYAREYPGRFVLSFRDKNGGVTQNAITGFQRCSGDLIAYLDADDVWLPDKLYKQVPLFADRNVVLSYHAAELFDSRTGKTLFVTNRRKREDIEDVRDIITKMGIPHTSSMMVRRAACPEYGFDSRIPQVSDWLFEIEVAMNGSIAKLDGVYSRYRQHANNAGKKSRSFRHQFEDVLDIVQEKYGHLPCILDSCMRGRARFRAGEAFRQLANDPEESRGLLAQAKDLDPKNIKYKLAYAATFFPLRQIALKSKYLLKRHVA